MTLQPASLALLLLVSGPVPAVIAHCTTYSMARRNAVLLEQPVVTVGPQTAVLLSQSLGTLHIQLFQGAVRFNRPTPQGRPFLATTFVLTQQVRIVHRNAAACVRVRGDRTSITVMEGAVQVKALSPNGESNTAEDEPAVQNRGSDGMWLRSGDRVELVSEGPDLVVRLENYFPIPSDCSSAWDWGAAVLEDGNARS